MARWLSKQLNLMAASTTKTHWKWCCLEFQGSFSNNIYVRSMQGLHMCTRKYAWSKSQTGLGSARMPFPWCWHSKLKFYWRIGLIYDKHHQFFVGPESCYFLAMGRFVNCSNFSCSSSRELDLRTFQFHGEVYRASNARQGRSQQHYFVWNENKCAAKPRKKVNTTRLK